jgi:hypothetical protein
MLSAFYIGESKSFTVTVTYDGTIPATGNNAWLYIKNNLEDDDDDAILIKEAFSVTVSTTMTANFVLTPTDTDIAEGSYFYELRWTNTANNIDKVLELSGIRINKRVAEI